MTFIVAWGSVSIVWYVSSANDRWVCSAFSWVTSRLDRRRRCYILSLGLNCTQRKPDKEISAVTVACLFHAVIDLFVVLFSHVIYERLSRMRVDESSAVMTSVYQGWEWMKALPLWRLSIKDESGWKLCRYELKSVKPSDATKIT